MMGRKTAIGVAWAVFLITTLMPFSLLSELEQETIGIPLMLLTGVFSRWLYKKLYTGSSPGDEFETEERLKSRSRISAIELKKAVLFALVIMFGGLLVLYFELGEVGGFVVMAVFFLSAFIGMSRLGELLEKEDAATND